MNPTVECDDLLKEIFGPSATHRTRGESTPEGRAETTPKWPTATP
ncbi:MAG: hypothetical protein ABIZ49_05380 [Opitutaceae bacterium]